MSTTNLDAYDLSQINLEGLIREDVMDKIWDISNVPLEFTSRAGSGTHSNPYFSWRVDMLQAPVTDGQLIDGQVVTTEANNTKNGRRVGTYSEIRGKRVEVSTRATEVNTIGFANALAENISRRQIELRRDIESTVLSNNPSIAGTDSVASQTAGLAAWLSNTNVDGDSDPGNVHRESGGADGGWDAVATDSLVAAATPGTTPVALTETNIRDVVQSIYEKGGEPSVLMSTPAVKRRISEYLFTDAARIATMTNESPGGSAPERKAQGSVDLFISDYGALSLIPNRLQPAFDTGNDIAYILDMKYLSLSYLQGYRVETLAKDALSSNRFMSVDVALKCSNWDALGAVCDIDATAPMTF